MAVNRNFLSIVGLFLGFHLISFPAKISGEQTLLFTFGDSSYDVGNKKFLSSEFVPATAWPYGDSVDDPTGRWSDGQIVPDFIGKMIGVAEPVPPVLDPKANLSRGASFATAGATVLGSSPSDTMSFAQQVTKFIELKAKWTDKQRAEALYMVYIGADDYLSFAKDNPNAGRIEQVTYIAKVLQKLQKNLGDLYKNGARKFAVQSLAPLGCLPIVRQDFKTGDECLEMLNFMASEHDERLRKVLFAMTVVYRQLRYSVFDFYSETLRRINEPSHYGYTDTASSCCGIGPRNAFGCGYSNVHSNLCGFQSYFLYFDGRHNTEKTNKAIADLFYNGDKNVVTPRNIKDLMRQTVTHLPLQET